MRGGLRAPAESPQNVWILGRLVATEVDVELIGVTTSVDLVCFLDDALVWIIRLATVGTG